LNRTICNYGGLLKMKLFRSFSGTITMIRDFWTDDPSREGCLKFMTVENSNGGIVDFVVTPTTYFVDQAMMRVGDGVIGFYDANVPVPAIYPPQYQALVMARVLPYQSVKVDHFDSQLVSSDGTLKLNLSPFTPIVLENGQAFTGNITNRDLIVVYGITTRSIPAQTTPYKIIVMCRLS
jgi:hypothetical protein